MSDIKLGQTAVSQKLGPVEGASTPMACAVVEESTGL